MICLYSTFSVYHTIPNLRSVYKTFYHHFIRLSHFIHLSASIRPPRVITFCCQRDIQFFSHPRFRPQIFEKARRFMYLCAAIFRKKIALLLCPATISTSWLVHFNKLLNTKCPLHCTKPFESIKRKVKIREGKKKYL